MAVCSKCNKEENIYNKTNILCKSCYFKKFYKTNDKYREKRKVQSLINHFENRDKKLVKMSEYRESGKARESWDKWFTKPGNREKHRLLSADYYEKNPGKCIKLSYEYKKNRMATDPEYKIRQNLSSRIYMAVKNDAGEKAFSTIKLIGCSIKDLRIHLEKQFKEGMNWDNYGEWHIDHIIPCANFNLINESEQLECFNWKNLQPLWEPENLSKGAKI